MVGYNSYKKFSDRAPSQGLKNHNKTFQKNQKGFAMVMFFSFLPIALCLVCALAGYSQFSLTKLKASNICRRTLLNGQDQIKNQLRKLIKLNPKARRLRAQIVSARKAYKIALRSNYAPAIATTAARLSYVKLQRKLLAARQELIKYNAQSISIKYKNQFEQKMRTIKGNMNLNVSLIPFAIEKVQKTNLTPDYKTKNFFSEKQSVKAQWTIKNYNFTFMKDLFNLNMAPAITGSCQTSLKKVARHQWQAYLLKKASL